MTPKAKEPQSASELEDESCTRRKRARRVSFAETTIHVFKRDEESESPVNSTPLTDGCRLSNSEESVGFRELHSQDDDSTESSPEEDEEEDGTRPRFLRDIDSSSPGSAVGSVTSNEDEIFFGPVSASFINSGLASESETSYDNNHDITLDSTAFSLHLMNKASYGDLSANSMRSLRTPTSDTISSMPSGLLVGRDQIGDLTSKCFVGEVSNVSEDWNTISPAICGPHNYDYEKLSQASEELMDQINHSMLQNSPNGDHKTSSHQTNEAGDISALGKDGTKFVNQNSFCDEPGIISCTFSSTGKPTSDESLLCSKTKTLLSHTINEKMQEIFSPANANEHAKVDETIHPEIVIAHGQHSEAPFPSHGELQNCLVGQSYHIHQELLRSATEAKSYPDSSPRPMSAVNSVPENVKQKLETVNTSHSPKSTAKTFHSSTPEETSSSSREKEQQRFFNQTVPSSSKILCISDRKNSASPMKSPKNISAFQLSAIETSASLKWEPMEHGVRISAIENHKTGSKVKSRMQSDYCSAPSWKDPAVTVLQHSTDCTSDDPNIDHTGISDVNVDSTKVITNKTEGMNILKDLDSSGNIGYLEKLDKNDALKNIDITILTPDNAVKTIQFSTLKGSISSFQAKHWQLQYGSVLSLNKSMHSSARELSASLKKEFIKHDERLSSIKSRITRSRFKSTPQTDCEATSSKKDLFITDFQGRLNETNSESCMKDPRISDVNMDADKQMVVLDIRNDMTFSAISSDVCVTLGANEIANSSCLLEHKSLQPAISLACTSATKVKNGENLIMPASSSNLVCHGKSDDGLSRFHVGGLYSDAKLSEFSAISNKTTERSIIGSYCEQASGENLTPSAKKFVECFNNHSVNKIDLASLKKFQGPLSNGHVCQNSESQQETYYGCNADAVGDREKEQTCHMENVCYSESYDLHKSLVNVPEVTGDSIILSVDNLHHEEALVFAAKETQKCWTDVLSKLSDTTTQLLPESISKLNMHKLDDLEGLLDDLQTARKYERLLVTLSSQNYFSDPYQKRVNIARSLLEKLGFAKARKQLKFIKLQKICNETLFFHSKVEECNKLKSSFTQLLSLSTRDIELDKEEHNRLMAMKQELGFLEQNIKVLVKYFEASCKLSGKMSYNDVIIAVDEHVMRKALCNDIQQHLQLWKLSDVVVKSDHYEVVLSYCHLLFQRFTINKNQFSSIVTTNFCNAANIIKKFPNMDASIAFEFVFKLNVDCKLANVKFIHERTVETNLLMGALIDVLEEILLSRLELWNLAFSTFLMQSSGELELQICFYSSSSGRKLVLGLDMTNLKCGVYLSNPSELKIQVNKQQTTFPSSTVNEAIRAVRSLDRGPLLILRLCRCISQVVQCSD